MNLLPVSSTAYGSRFALALKASEPNIVVLSDVEIFDNFIESARKL